MRVTNKQDEPLFGQTLDFLVQPLSGGAFYRATGAPVAETINGTDAWFIRFNVDIAVDEWKHLSIYPSNAQPPTLLGVEYPGSFAPNELHYIYASWTNPISGILSTRIEISLNDGPFLSYGMPHFSGDQYMYVLLRPDPASIRFRVSATDYSGQTTTSDVYSIPSATIGAPPPIHLLLILGGAGAVVIVVIVVIVFLRRRRSPS
jgi:hypothetical protein